MEVKLLCFFQPIWKPRLPIIFSGGDILDKRTQIIEGLSPETSGATVCSSLKCIKEIPPVWVFCISFRLFIYSTIVFLIPFHIIGDILINNEHRPFSDGDKISTAKVDSWTNTVQGIYIPAAFAHHSTFILYTSSPPSELFQTPLPLQFLSGILSLLFCCWEKQAYFPFKCLPPSLLPPWRISVLIMFSYHIFQGPNTFLYLSPWDCLVISFVSEFPIWGYPFSVEGACCAHLGTDLQGLECLAHRRWMKAWGIQRRVVLPDAAGSFPLSEPGLLRPPLDGANHGSSYLQWSDPSVMTTPYNWS